MQVLGLDGAARERGGVHPLVLEGRPLEEVVEEGEGVGRPGGPVNTPIRGPVEEAGGVALPVEISDHPLSRLLILEDPAGRQGLALGGGHGHVHRVPAQVPGEAVVFLAGLGEAGVKGRHTRREIGTSMAVALD